MNVFFSKEDSYSLHSYLITFSFSPQHGFCGETGLYSVVASLEYYKNNKEYFQI